jgi:putative endonuclease
MYYFMYILKSVKYPGKKYIGFTKQPQQRLIQHNNGESTYTRSFRPWKIIYYEAYASRKDAYERERQLKKHAKAWGQLKRRIQHSIHED